MPNTYIELDDDTQMFYNRVMLVRALPNLAHDRFGQKKELPTRNTRKMLFRKYNALSTATTALTEGVTPAGSSLAITDVSVTLSQYGDFVTVTDVATWASRDAVLTEAAEVLGEQAGQSLDIIYRDVLVAGTNVQYSNGAARASVNTVISATPIDKVIRQLKVNNAKFFTSMIKASTGVGTSPIRAAFWAIVHPEVEYTLEGVTGYKTRESYPAQTSAEEGEVGAYRNVRFVSSTQAKIFLGGGASGGSSVKETSTLADVYATMVFAKNAYAIVPLSGHSLENIVKPLGSAGSLDPLNQRATSGWKAMTAAKILDDSFMSRVESAAAA
jgi:N4-gp56 family major capsid protein